MPMRMKILAAGMAFGALAFGALPALAQTNGAAVAAADLTQGAYLARVGDCAACHTAPGGKAFAGGVSFKLPMGTIYASNITPDKTDGIGAYSEQDFARALRQGIRKDGATLYPAMPYPSYARISDADIHALYVYFSTAVPPVAEPNRPADITWPLSMRWPLTIWRWAYAPAVKPAAAGGSDAQLARGAYLVEGLGHCGACHTGRGVGLEEKALSNTGSGTYLAGGAQIDGYLPPSLRADALSGLGAWSDADIVAFLKDGRNQHGSVFGSMTPVIEDSTQYMTDADLQAVAAYLKSLSADTSGGAAFVYDDTVAKELHAGVTTAPGALDYLNNCAACHRSDGRGYPGVFPVLAGNPVLQSGDGGGIVRIILTGSTVPGVQNAPSAFTMPAFADRLSDQQVADLTNFIRTSWGNKGGTVTPSDVAGVRKTLPSGQAAAGSSVKGTN